MYQEIDDQDEDDIPLPAKASILPFIIGAILAGLVFFAVWLFSPGQQIAPGLTVETPASRDAYLEALSEPIPAFRRARLMDYQNAYPDTDRAGAIADQLNVINTAELADWESLSKIVYNDRLEISEKQTALSAYEARWNGRLLGGRGDELDALKQRIDETIPIEPQPDRRLEEGKSPIPENVPSDTLAGAPPRMAVTFPIYEPPPPPPEVVEAPKDIVVQPSVRRNVSPSYPRTAKRRKVSAIVTISMNIDEKGRVDDATLVDIQAERYEKDFTKASIRAAKRTRFNPKTINGQPVPARDVRKRYIFRIN